MSKTASLILVVWLFYVTLALTAGCTAATPSSDPTNAHLIKLKGTESRIVCLPDYTACFEIRQDYAALCPPV